MNKPTYDDVAAVMLIDHPDIIKDAEYRSILLTDGSTASWANIGMKQSYSGGLVGTIYTKVFLLDDWAQIDNELIDKRRKRRFHYNKYGRIEILVADIVEYMAACYKNDYTAERRAKKLVKKWGKSLFHKQYDDHINGKIITTF